MKFFFLYILFISVGYSDNFKNLKILDIESRSEMKKYMKEISLDLGIKCSHCHDLDNKSKDTKEKDVAREMMELTIYLNNLLNKVSSEHKDYKTYITCWTCHHGKLNPEHIRPTE